MQQFECRYCRQSFEPTTWSNVSRFPNHKPPNETFYACEGSNATLEKAALNYAKPAKQEPLPFLFGKVAKPQRRKQKAVEASWYEKE
jgi:hypothetical protein